MINEIFRTSDVFAHYRSKVKEFTLVDMMVLLDCAANIAVIGVMFLAFPVRVWGDPYLCLLFHFYRVFVASINRVIPVVVVLYRVMMVCHVEFCLRHGEKVIRDKLFREENYADASFILIS